MKTTLLSLALLLLLVSPGHTADKKLWAKSFLGKKPPELKVEKWLTPEPDTKGKFVIIDFWATWCGPCLEAIPELNKFHKKYPDQLVVIGISDEPEATVKGLTKPRITYASAIDPQARTKKAMEVTGIPHVIILDPEGIVRWEGFPFLNGFELNDAVLQELFTKYGKPDAPKTPVQKP